jgi:uncharacterized membrane protein
VIQAQASLLLTLQQLLYILYHPRLYLYHNLKDINIRELNNLKVFESKKIKGHKSIAFMNSMNIR